VSAEGLWDKRDRSSISLALKGFSNWLFALPLDEVATTLKTLLLW
jgi:hypothetical protein